MPPERRMIAKKSAPSRYNPSPVQRSSSPISLEDQLVYIEKYGVAQRDGCKECRNERRESKCLVAAKISPRCGNCLRAGKECHFTQTSDSEEDEGSTRGSVTIIQEDDVVIRKRPKLKLTPKSMFAENLVNYDLDDTERPTRLATFNSTPEKMSIEPSASIPASATISKPHRRRPLQTSPRLHTKLTHNPRTSAPPRQGTPPLALESHDEPPFTTPPAAFHFSSLPLSSTELSVPQRNLIVMAMQQQIDWGAVAAAAGVTEDKVMKWWLKASPELIRRG